MANYIFSKDLLNPKHDRSSPRARQEAGISLLSIVRLNSALRFLTLQSKVEILQVTSLYRGIQSLSFSEKSDAQHDSRLWRPFMTGITRRGKKAVALQNSIFFIFSLVYNSMWHSQLVWLHVAGGTHRPLFPRQLGKAPWRGRCVARWTRLHTGCRRLGVRCWPRSWYNVKKSVTRMMSHGLSVACKCK